MLEIKEEWVNETEGHGLGDSGWYVPFTDDLGRLFLSLPKEYGRCVSRVYVDGPDGQSWPQGWVFQKRRVYEGSRCSKDTYIAETWVTMRHVATSKED